MLPNALIIGAAKCGTTSLHHYLRRHPRVFMSGRKELQFFNREDWRQRAGWYERQFPADLPVRGEASPQYTMEPRFAGVAERVHALLPDARLIYLVGDPIERLLRHFVELQALRIERRPFGEALADVDDPANVYVATSRYMTQLERYRALFGDEQLLVIDQDDLRGRRERTLREVFEFLGVEAMPAGDEALPTLGEATPAGDESVPVPAGQALGGEAAQALGGEAAPLLNVGDEKVTLNAAGERVLRFGGRRVVRRLVVDPPPVIGARLRAAITEPVERPQLEPAKRAELERLLGDEVERLRAYTGKPLAGWSL